MIEAISRIRPVDKIWMERARERQLQLTKPPGSLGRLEEIANRMAAIQATLTPVVKHPTIVLFAADHGVCAEGINPYPQAVTAQMVANFLRGGAAINTIAQELGVELAIVDAGVAYEMPVAAGLISRPIARGTRNFCEETAMTQQQASSALALGTEMAERAADSGCTLLGIGEMGIGNTTAASALAAGLTGMEPRAVLGRGTGADDACMARKLSAIERALALHKNRLSDPYELLAALGGFEIASMCGLCLGAASRGCAVLVDGFISTTAAALAVRMCLSVRDYLIPAHRSTEPGQDPLLEIIGQAPLFDFAMRLGEGTGAALAVPIVRAAVAAFTRMATFESAGVSKAVKGTP